MMTGSLGQILYTNIMNNGSRDDRAELQRLKEIKEQTIKLSAIIRLFFDDTKKNFSDAIQSNKRRILYRKCPEEIWYVMHECARHGTGDGVQHWSDFVKWAESEDLFVKIESHFHMESGTDVPFIKCCPLL